MAFRAINDRMTPHPYSLRPTIYLNLSPREREYVESKAGTVTLSISDSDAHYQGGNYNGERLTTAIPTSDPSRYLFILHSEWRGPAGWNPNIRMIRN